VRERETLLLDRYIRYARTRIAECEFYMKGNFTLSVKDREWREFEAFGDNGILSIKTTNSSIDSIRLKKGEDESIPYITRTDKNNGVSLFVSQNNIEVGYDVAGTISVGLDTQTAFYQPHDYVTGQNIHVISGECLNHYTAQFLLVVLRNQMCAKFNWGGNGATLGRMKKLKVLLPVNSDGEPDYEYMEQYTRNMIIRKYEQYLRYMEDGRNV